MTDQASAEGVVEKMEQMTVEVTGVQTHRNLSFENLYPPCVAISRVRRVHPSECTKRQPSSFSAFKGTNHPILYFSFVGALCSLVIAGDLDGRPY